MNMVGNARGGAKDQALHLLKAENEHAEVYELRGFISDTLMGALNEVYAVSRGTKCKQYLYSLSLNPPPSEKVSTVTFLDAIERVEKKLRLTDQPRAIVFHEKKGRRHAHCVWSRIDTTEMKAVQMSYDHRKLNAVSRELFLEHGWQMPAGLAKSSERNPKNFSLAEWQQAKRTGKDPRQTRAAIQDAWAISDSKTAFIHALEERGFKLARGDKTAFVAVDFHGEIYSVAKLTGVKTKSIRARVGAEKDLPGVDEVKDQIANELVPVFHRLKEEIETNSRGGEAEFEKRRSELVKRQHAERECLKGKQEWRWIEASKARQSRFRTGLKGMWDRLRGEHSRIRKDNEREAEDQRQRDRSEQDQLAFKHLDQRRHLDTFRLRSRRHYIKERRVLEKDRERYSAPSPGKSRKGPEILP